MGVALIVIGIIVAGIGGIWFLVEVFRDSIGWGVLCLLIGPASLIYLVLNWSDVKNPFFVQLGGLALYIIGIIIAGDGASYYVD